MCFTRGIRLRYQTQTIPVGAYRGWFGKEPLSEASDAEDIEVGVWGGDLRYWQAKEGVRQGEARLAAQANVRSAMEGRATALTGWAAGSLLAAAAAGFGSPGLPARAGAAALAIPLFCAAVSCIHTARPRDWAMVGYDPTIIAGDTLDMELEILESIAVGLSKGIQDNNALLNEMGSRLRLAGWLLIAAPFIGGAAYALVGGLPSLLLAAVNRPFQ